jgi:predicted outer membrane protein
VVRIRTRGVIGMGLLALAVVACGEQADDADDMSDSIPPAAETPAPAPGGGALSDAATLQILDAVNNAEIQEGELAGQKAQNAEVKAYAQQVVAEHKQLLAATPKSVGAAPTGAAPSGTAPGTPGRAGAGATDTAGRSAAGRATTPPPPAPATPSTVGATSAGGSAEPMLSQLKQQADSMRTVLQGLSGAEFDRAYIDHQAMAHQKVLDMINQQMMPGATDPQVKQALEGARPVVEGHLQRAKDLQTKVGGRAGGSN